MITRYLFKESLKFLLFFFFGLYFVYAILDFSTHSARLFTYSKVSIFSIMLYYLNQLVLKLPLFLPFAYLLSLLKTLFSLNLSGELTVLFMSGFSLKKILFPFFTLSCFFVMFCLTNFEFISPHAAVSIESFKNSHLRKSIKKAKHLNISLCKDQTRLIYQEEDGKFFYDVYWIVSFHELWHMKKFSPSNAKGYFVDQLLRKDGKLIKSLSLKERSFPIEIKERLSLDRFDNLSFSALLKKHETTQKERAAIKAQISYRFFLSLLPLFIFFGVTPYCLCFSKTLSVFTVTLVSIFIFLFFYSLIDMSLLLAENQTPSFSFLFIPLGLILGFSIRKFQTI